MTIIQTEGLSKRYGNTIAVDNVSIHVKKGEIYGFLGLNRAENNFDKTLTWTDQI